MSRDKFLAKVLTMEAWVASGKAPDGYEWPSGPVALRKWSDANLGLEPWASPNIASGAYPELRARFDAAVDALNTVSRLQTRKASRPESREFALLKAQVAALQEQVVVLLDEVQALTEALRFEKEASLRIQRRLRGDLR